MNLHEWDWKGIWRVAARTRLPFPLPPLHLLAGQESVRQLYSCISHF
jgi:hypothetical protein